MKLFADTAKSVKEILPERLESKEVAQGSLETSMTLLNDKSVSVEVKEWELNTRQELVKSMVHLTAIETTYNVVRGATILTFFALVMHYWTWFFTRRKGS